MLGTRWSKAASASLHLTREPRGPGKSNSANFSSPTRQFQSSFHSKVKGLLVCIANCKSAQRNFFKSPVIYANIEKDEENWFNLRHCPELRRKWGWREDDSWISGKETESQSRITLLAKGLQDQNGQR